LKPWQKYVRPEWSILCIPDRPDLQIVFSPFDAQMFSSVDEGSRPVEEGCTEKAIGERLVWSTAVDNGNDDGDNDEEDIEEWIHPRQKLRQSQSGQSMRSFRSPLSG
jgi:hypothetical protein